MTRRVLLSAILIVITSVPVFSAQRDIYPIPQKDCQLQYWRCMTTTCPLPDAPDCFDAFLACMTSLTQQ